MNEFSSRESWAFRVLEKVVSNLKREYFGKIQENEELGGDVFTYAAQVAPQFDAGIHKKDRFRMETN